MAACSPGYLILDIETIPDRTLFAPPEPGPDGERPFPPLFACRPVVIGVMWLAGDLSFKRLGTIGTGKEAQEQAMLADFATFMAHRRPRLITWNGRGFDLPVLALRSLRHGLSWPWYYRESDHRWRSRWDRHLDVCDFLADHGAARKTGLDGAARLIGLPGKQGMDGTQVEGLFQSGQLEILRHYCLRDVTLTAFLFLRARLLAGQLDRAGYRRCAGDLLEAVAADPRVATLATSAERERLLLDPP